MARGLDHQGGGSGSFFGAFHAKNALTRLGGDLRGIGASASDLEAPGEMPVLLRAEFGVSRRV